MTVDPAVMSNLYNRLGVSSTEVEPTSVPISSPEDRIPFGGPSISTSEPRPEKSMMERIVQFIPPELRELGRSIGSTEIAQEFKESPVGTTLEFIGPGADVKVMQESSARVLPRLREGDITGGLADLGIAAASIPMMAIPGTLAGVQKGLRKFAPEDIEIAMKTGEAKGFIGPRAVTPRYVSETSKAEDTILNYGAGKHDQHTPMLREKGLNIEAHDFHNPNPEALGRKHDTVFGSNVINVQDTNNMLKNTLDEMTETVASDGRLIVNLPVSPRKGAWTGDITDTKKLRGLLKDRFESVNIVDGTGSAPVFEARIPKLKQSKSKIKRTRTRPQDRDYPTTRLGDKLSDKNTIQFLEDHGYTQYTPDLSTNKDMTWEYIDDGIRAYTPYGKGIEQKTFNNPTLKNIRRWMGYKQGGSIVERNPNSYNMRAI